MGPYPDMVCDGSILRARGSCLRYVSVITQYYAAIVPIANDLVCDVTQGLV